MHHSLDSLEAFLQAAAQGSFSAAARKLGKSQSSISESIANLEIDLGVKLFDRGQRQPTLTPEGAAILEPARQILNANERLNRSASQLAGGMEPRLSVAMSDTFQSESFENLLAQIDARYPELEFECIIAEHADVLDLIQRDRAHLGLLAAQAHYPPDITHATLPELSEIALYAGRMHPLAARAGISLDDLAEHRELRMTPHGQTEAGPPPGRIWSAPSYLMLLEMAALGYGWTELPRWMHKRFGVDQLVELRVAGWPRTTPVDLAWSARRRLGSAGAWLVRQLLESDDPPRTR